MSLTADVIRRAVLVAHAKNARFVELVGMAEVDRATAFRGASMRRTDLRGEDLSGFDFTGADFDGADVRGADFRRALGIKAEMFRHAIVDQATRWPWEITGAVPVWYDDWGVDEYGRWVSFSVSAADGSRVVQRMRWIPPGHFMRGSPDGEDGHFDNEGPRREVTIADGFWLFDTPCTQALWEAVMDDNPSRFRSRTRPMEQVSFTDVRAFLRKLNALVPGLNLELPSEARWEYACRAGTTEVTYAGETQILGEYNAPVLDAIAWYGGNSGVGFELDNGYDSSDWSEKQYEHARAGTHPVAQKAANPLGLYDMLGNVWEWCADQWRDNYDGAPDDGSAWIGRRGAASRVVRGGSWLAIARRVRAACRAYAAPAYRVDYLGFRCAQVQDARGERKAERSAGQGRAGRSKPGERSERAATTSPQRRR